jgi:hypothetical protein
VSAVLSQFLVEKRSGMEELGVVVRGVKQRAAVGVGGR